MSIPEVRVPLMEELAGSLHISYSQISTYLICPAKYAHQYVWGTPWETKPAALAFGSAIHRAAEAYYLNLKETGEVLPVEDLIAVFKDVLDSEKACSEQEWSFKNGEDFESIDKQGAELLRLFHAEITPQRIMAVEFPFMVSVPDLTRPGESLPVKLTGFFDLLENDDETYVVGELKTASQRFSSLRLAYDLQPTVYSYAMTKLGLVKEPESCLVRYDVLLKTRKPAFERYFVTRTESDHHHLIELVNQILHAIDQRVFYRNTGWQCSDCQFQKACLG